MNKIIKKAVACTLVAGTVLAGTTAISMPAQAATIKSFHTVKMCKHSNVTIKGNSNKGTITVKEKGKTFTYNYTTVKTKQVSKKSTKNGITTWTETEQVRLNANGTCATNKSFASNVKLKTITKKYTKKQGKKATCKVTTKNYDVRTSQKVGTCTIDYKNIKGNSAFVINRKKCSTCEVETKNKVNIYGYSSASTSGVASFTVNLKSNGLIPSNNVNWTCSYSKGRSNSKSSNTLIGIR